MPPADHTISGRSAARIARAEVYRLASERGSAALKRAAGVVGVPSSGTKAELAQRVASAINRHNAADVRRALEG